MTPKAQQLGAYDVPEQQIQDDKKGHQTISHQRSPSTSSSLSSSDIIVNHASNNPTAFLFLLLGLSNRITNVIHPSIIFLIATPIALQYPMIQFVMLLGILVGTSPLYFILITFIGKSNKHNNYNNYNKSSHHHLHNHSHHHHQPHRRQPSIVGSIAEISGIDKTIR